MNRLLKRRAVQLLILLLVIGAGLLGVVSLLIEEPVPPDDPPLPEPNGYERLAELGSLLDSKSVQNLHRSWGQLEWQLERNFEDSGEREAFLEERELFLQALHAHLEEHESWFEELDTALGLEARVPIDYEQDPVASPIFTRLLVLRKISLLLELRWLQEVREKRYEAARQTALRLLQLSRSSGVGGVILHRLVGLAIHEMGLKRLRPLLPHLDRAGLVEAREVLAKTREILEASEEGERAIQRDRYWSQRHASFPEAVQQLFQREAIERPLEHARREGRKIRAASGLVELEVAVFLHRQEHGRDPSRLADLVPAFVPEIPEDPCGSGPLRVMFREGEVVLYGVGADGEDDGALVPESRIAQEKAVIVVPTEYFQTESGPSTGPHDYVLTPTPTLPEWEIR